MASVRLGLYALAFITALIIQELGKCYSDILSASVRYIVPFIAVRIVSKVNGSDLRKRLYTNV
jgi:hypothetical protein